MGEPFNDGRLTDSRFTHQHGVILCSPTENLNHSLYLAFASYNGIQFTITSKLGEIPAKGAESRSFRLALTITLHRLFLVLKPLKFFIRFLGRKIWVNFGQNLITRPLDIHVQSLEDSRGNPFPLTEQAKQNMLSSNIRVVESLCLLVRESQHFFHSRSVGNIPRDFLVRASPHLLLNLHSDRLQIEPHPLKHADCDSLPELYQSKQEMLGTNVVVVEAVSLFAGKRQDLLGPRSKIIHESATVSEGGCNSSLSWFAIIAGGSSDCNRLRMISARIASLCSGFNFSPECS